MIVLTVIEKGSERQYVVKERLITVGRAPDNLVEIKDAKSSRHHCQIQAVEDDYFLKDLDSHNGTLLNGRKIDEAKLHSGDRIHIGLTNILFEIKEEEGFWKDEQTAMLNLFETEKERDNLRKLLHVSLEINRELDLQKLLNVIIDGAIEVTGAERGLVILDSNGSMKIALARNFKQEEIAEAERQISFSILREVRKKGKPVITDNASEDRRFDGSVSVHGLNLRSIICLPLKARDKVIGLVYLDNRFEMGAFSQTDLKLVEAFCNHVAIALENAQLYEKVARQREELEKINRDLSNTVEDQTRAINLLEKSGLELPLKYDYKKIIGTSGKMQEVFHLLDRVTDSAIPVLVQGESGTGKELCARAIHFNGPRKDKPFVTENCAALTETLLESELFGHVRGAFTGADRDRKGLFEIADGGTLFLDEVADMSPAMQAKLLRAIEAGEIRPVGGKTIAKVDVRIVATSNKDLKKMVEAGEFREDLFYRLNVVTVNLPPLRERREDIPLLVDHFLAQAVRESGQQKRRIDRKCVALMTEYDWPGNIRELENEIKRLVALSSDTITPVLLSERIRPGKAPAAAPVEIGEGGLKDAVQKIVESVERGMILKVLEETGWRKSEAARRLKISRPTLDAKIEAYKIKKPG
ncbi:MAG: sigma 54-interacting transcriptional regulator [Planctomycetota bacterium]